MRNVVCLHGLGRIPSDWDGVREGLGAFGSVRAPEIPADPTAALERVDRAVAAGDVLVGHSLGAILALRLAHDRPRPLQAVVLTGCFFPPARNGRSLSRSVADYAAHRIAFVRSLDRGGSPRGSARGLSSVFRLALGPGYYDALARASPSILVVHARDDHLVPVDFALAAVQRHAGWSMRVLEHGGHSAHVHEPASWLAAVSPWLEGA